MKKFIYSMFALAISAMTFTSCEDVPAPYALPGNEDPVVIEPTGSGTLEDPYNVAAAFSAVANLTWTSNTEYETTEEVYVKGKISKIVDNGTFGQSGTFGNATFYIKDDGGNDEFYCYRILYLGNKKYTSGEDIKVGDEVVVCGKLMNYRGNTPETVSNAAYLYSLNGVTEGGGDTPTAIEVTCAKAVELTSALDDNATSSEVYAVTGYITEVVGSVSKNQQTFWMADTKDGGKVFEAYYANLPEGVTEFKKGSKVKITGNLLKYVNNNTGAMTPEIKNADVVILEEGDGGGSGGGGDVPSGIEINCAKAVELTTALADNATSSEVYAVTGYITEVVGNVSKNQQTFWMADTKDGEKMFQAYYANLPEGVSAFKKGSKVKIVGNLLKYVNSNTGAVTPEIKNADVVILEEGDSGSGGGGSEGGGGGDDSSGGNSVSFATNSGAQSWAAATDGTYGVGFGTTAQGLNIGYYKHTSSSTLIAPNENHVRVYKNSALSIATTDGKKIKKIIIGCAPNAGTTSYCFDMSGLEGGASATCDKSALTVTWTGSATKVVLHANNGQVRMEKLTVEFE